MHPRTEATLKELERAPWFSCVGINDTETARVLTSWQEAIEYCSRIEWENLCLEECNQYRERLQERSKERLQKWNEIVEEIKQITIPFVKGKTEQVVTQHHLPVVFEHMVNWDVLGICMEAEYADVYPPGFYASQAYWYVKGHFPCGWEGDFPKGRLIVY